MNAIDTLFVVRWWFGFLALGVLFLPLAFRIFQSFVDKGYIFAKVLGMLLVNYIAFLLGSLHIVSFTQPTIFANSSARR